MITFDRAGDRVDEISNIEQAAGRVSGHALYKMILACADKSSYADQEKLKRDLAGIKMPPGGTEDVLRSKLQELWRTWKLIAGNCESKPHDAYMLALQMLPVHDPEVAAYVGSVRALLHLGNGQSLWSSWSGAHGFVEASGFLICASTLSAKIMSTK